MFNRRKFISLLGLSPIIACQAQSSQSESNNGSNSTSNIILTTWNNQNANNTAYKVLSQGNILDAIEEGIKTVEADPNDHSVGYGGLPDREGNVTLDACIMDQNGNAGAVTYLKNYKHPISIARKVMTDTPHVILSGEGAAQYAESQGFVAENLLTEHSKSEWQKWLLKSEYKPIINIENHDTIGMLCRDSDGNLSGGCSTSGLAYKMAGRVGDSPIIGSGLYVDNEIGCCVATGLGEEVLKNVSSFLVVELMRNGQSPYDACKAAILRIIDKANYKDFQVGLIAISKQGKIGAFSIHPGFKYTLTIQEQTTVNEADSYV